MGAISDLPMPNDIDAGHSPPYVKPARSLRGKIESGRCQHGDDLPSADLAREHGLSPRVARHALATLASSRYAHRPGRFTSHSVTCQAVPR